MSDTETKAEEEHENQPERLTDLEYSKELSEMVEVSGAKHGNLRACP